MAEFLDHLGQEPCGSGNVARARLAVFPGSRMRDFQGLALILPTRSSERTIGGATTGIAGIRLVACS